MLRLGRHPPHVLGGLLAPLLGECLVGAGTTTVFLAYIACSPMAGPLTVEGDYCGTIYGQSTYFGAALYSKPCWLRYYYILQSNKLGTTCGERGSSRQGVRWVAVGWYALIIWVPRHF